MMKNLRQSVSFRRGQSGFSIIEALIAGLVLSFGMLALVGVQVTLSRNSDVANQRTEATRLAQQTMENLRTYAATAAETGVLSYAGLAGSTSPHEVFTIGNTAFTRSWTVSGGGGDTGREVRVLVAWTDRGGAAQSVALTSMVARTRLFDLGMVMGNVLDKANPRAPLVKQRNANVPYPATNIGNNRSTYNWPGTSLWYVFNNDTAGAMYRCTNRPDSNTNLATTCQAIFGYVVSGYLSVEIPTGNNSPDDFDAVLSPWLVNGCDVASRANINSVSCFVRPVMVGGAVNPSCPYILAGSTVSTTEATRLKYYKCYAALIEAGNGTSGWGGKMIFSAAPQDKQKICRFDHVSTNSSGLYAGVRQALGNENYFALGGDDKDTDKDKDKDKNKGKDEDCLSGQTQHQPSS